MAEGLDESEVEATIFHGALYKLDRLGEYLKRARYARNAQNWNDVYSWLEAIYAEVESYLWDNMDKKRIEILDKSIKTRRKLCRDELEKQNTPNHNCRGLLWDWEIDLRRALKVFRMDMPEKTEGSHIRGVI